MLMRTNNRMPVYQPKDVDLVEKKYRTVKNGKSVWVKGEKPDPYKNVSCQSLSLRSRIETGVFESHEGTARKAEKVDGFDRVNQQVQSSIIELETHNSETRRVKASKRAVEEAEKKLKNLREQNNV